MRKASRKPRLGKYNLLIGAVEMNCRLYAWPPASWRAGRGGTRQRRGLRYTVAKKRGSDTVPRRLERVAIAIEKRMDSRPFARQLVASPPNRTD